MEMGNTSKSQQPDQRAYNSRRPPICLQYSENILHPNEGYSIRSHTSRTAKRTPHVMGREKSGWVHTSISPFTIKVTFKFSYKGQTFLFMGRPFASDWCMTTNSCPIGIGNCS